MEKIYEIKNLLLEIKKEKKVIKIAKQNLDLAELNLRNNFENIIEVMAKVENDFLKNESYELKEKALVWKSKYHYNIEIEKSTIRFKNDKIKFKYGYSGHYSCGEDWKISSIVSIPHFYFYLSLDELYETHMQWIIKFIETYKAKKQKSQEEQQLLKEKEFKKNEFEQYLKLKAKFENNES